MWQFHTGSALSPSEGVKFAGWRTSWCPTRENLVSGMMPKEALLSVSCRWGRTFPTPPTPTPLCYPVV